VVLTGGSTLNSSFAKENLIDEIIFNVEPFVLGKGISVFRSDKFEFKLKLKGVKQLKNNIVQLHYLVDK